jgi:hypothetical protein
VTEEMGKGCVGFTHRVSLITVPPEDFSALVALVRLVVNVGEQVDLQV